MDEHEQPPIAQNDPASLEEPETETQPVNEFVKQVEPVQTDKKKRRLILMVIAAVVLVALVTALGVFLTRKKPAPATSQNTNTQSQEQPKATINQTTERYSSSQFFLEIDIPKGWEIKDEPGTGVLTATSPELAIPTNGNATNGKVVLTMRGPSQKLPEFDKGNATAVMDSEKVSYTKPSAAQRGQTYLSFLSYPSSANAVYIDGIFITGDFGYTKDQAIPKVDVQKVDPIISITFVGCDGTCTKPISLSQEGWKSAEFGGVLKKILLSLTVN